MKKMMIISLVFMMVSLVYGTKLGVLKNVMKPETVQIDGNNIYILEGATVSVFSLIDLSFAKQFGKTGEGPAEQKRVPFFTILLKVFPEYISEESFDELLYFTKDGSVIKEIKKPMEVKEVIPVGKNFVAKKIESSKDGNQYVAVVLLNEKLEILKELYRQKFSASRDKLEVIPDVINLVVCDQKIFIDESPNGFFIRVFDSAGKELYQIHEKDYQPVKITQAHKDYALEQLKNDPMVKGLGSWERFSKNYQFLYPEALPAIDNMMAAGKQIFVKTHHEKDGKILYIVMDLKGKILKKAYLPPVIKRSLVDEQFGMGKYYYSIQGDTFYYLVENEASEEWELHTAAIK